MDPSRDYDRRMLDFAEALDLARRSLAARQRILDARDAIREQLAKLDAELVEQTAHVRKTRERANHARHELLYALWSDTPAFADTDADEADE